MENEELIRQQMENTRSSITEKLETLEEKVTDDIQVATGSVAETVKAVKETVEAVKDTVEGGTDVVKEAVQEGVQTVKHWFDLKSQVQEHPWVVMAGAAGVGFCLGSLMPAGARALSAVAAPASTSSHGRTHHNGHGTSQAKRRSERSSTSSWLGLGDFAPQISKLKGLAITALLDSVRSMVLKSVPAQAGGVIKEVIDGISQKLGGEKLADDHSASPFGTGYQQGEEHEQRDQFDRAKMGRSMGPTSG